MFAIEKVLKRKDAASVLVAIVLGMMTWQFLSAVTQPLVNKIVDTPMQSFGESTFSTEYGLPIVGYVLGVTALELLLLIVAGVKTLAASQRTAKKKK